VPRPEGKQVVGSRWIYKFKDAVDGSLEKLLSFGVPWEVVPL
jgi:hypothetical protein